MVKTLTLRLDEDTYRFFSQAAQAENRSIPSLIRTAALAQIREQQFTDAAETAEILGDEALLRRIETGSREARLRKGRWVE